MSMGAIQRAGVEDEVLKLAAAGKSQREIATELAAHGVEVSHAAVGRFLRKEAKGRERARRAVSAERAQVVTAKAGEKALDHVEVLNRAVGVLATMVEDGYHTIRVPGAKKPMHVPLEARERVQAARHLQTVAGFLIDLAADKPRSVNGIEVAQARKLIAEVFGHSFQADPSDVQEAPLTPEEHSPPVLN